jgi:uncharacterized membrane protein YciS (DUF1049 family)
MFFLIFALVLCVPLTLFALTNTAMVTLGIWPTDYSIEVHLSIAILVAMGVAFVFGGVLVWFSALAQRQRARRAERAVRLLEAQVAELKGRPSLMLPPAA